MLTHAQAAAALHHSINVPGCCIYHVPLLYHTHRQTCDDVSGPAVDQQLLRKLCLLLVICATHQLHVLPSVYMDSLDLLHVLPLPAMMPSSMQLGFAALVPADHWRCQS